MRPPTGTVIPSDEDSGQLDELLKRLDDIEQNQKQIAEHLQQPLDAQGMVDKLLPYWPASKLNFLRDTNGDGRYDLGGGKFVDVPATAYPTTGTEVFSQTKRPGEPFEIGVKGRVKVSPLQLK